MEQRMSWFLYCLFIVTDSDQIELLCCWEECLHCKTGRGWLDENVALLPPNWMCCSISGILLPFFSISSLASLQKLQGFPFKWYCVVVFTLLLLLLLLFSFCCVDQIIWETMVLYMFIAFSSCLFLGSDKHSICRFYMLLNAMFIFCLQISAGKHDLDFSKSCYITETYHKPDISLIVKKKGFWNIEWYPARSERLKFYFLYIWLWKQKTEKKKKIFSI